MVLTVLIAMEFKHSLLIVLHQQRDIVQIRSVVLIALLAMVRKFIILDIYQTQPAVVFALAAASLSLGIVFWLVRNEDAAGPASEMAKKEADAEADNTRHLSTVGSHEQWHITEKIGRPPEREDVHDYADKKTHWRNIGATRVDRFGCCSIRVRDRFSSSSGADSHPSSRSLHRRARKTRDGDSLRSGDLHCHDEAAGAGPCGLLYS
jgi:hypothetical protein